MTTIENRRFALLVAVGVVIFLLYRAWQTDFPGSPLSPPTATGNESEPKASTPAVGDGVPAAVRKAQPAAIADQDLKGATAARIRVETDVLAVEISTEGGDLRRAELKGFPFAKKRPEQNVTLLDDRGTHWFVIQSGLTGTDQALASHKDLYRTALSPKGTDVTLSLAAGADQIEVPLEHTGANGVTVTKTYRFKRGSYVVELVQAVRNESTAPLTASPYVQLWQTPFAVGEEPPFVKSFSGLGLYEQKSGTDSYRFRKIAFKDLAEKPVELKQTGGWLAMVQHYFFAAVIPPPGEAVTYIGKPSATRGYLAQYIGASQEIAAQGEKNFRVQLYVGPKLQTGFTPQPETRSVLARFFALDGLEYVAPGLEYSVDYGILTPVAEPLFWLLDRLHRLTGNWGAAIILLTLAVKLALYKLSEAQFRSMAKMKKYGPRIQELKERYGDDRERLQKAMMELYKKEKFNPLAGCWPLLVQFPVFISLYWVLLESVELRQADFALWLNDLSAPDPYYVLPVLFGISMFVQQRFSGNVVMDPMQQRVMNIMPVMLTVFFAFFPVGLVLYWLVSNLIGIAQQWYISRTLAKEGLSHR